MPPETGSALLILVAFVLPGFVTLRFNELTHIVRGEESPFDRLLHALYYSALIYGVLLVGAVILGFDRAGIETLIRDEQSLWKILLLAFSALVALPFLVSQLGRLWRQSTRLRPQLLEAGRVSLAHSTPSGWDHFFRVSGPAFVRITLKDGRVVGGFYGPNSFAGYSEEKQDLYLEERWELDEDSWFKRRAESSLGVWVPKESFVSIELYEPPTSVEASENPSTIEA